MSNSSNHRAEPSDRKVLISALAWLGVFFIFAVIVIIAYVPNRAVDVEAVNAEARLQIKGEVLATQKRLVNSYEWVDQNNGVVRIPVQRAMELTLADLKPAQTPPAP